MTAKESPGGRKSTGASKKFTGSNVPTFTGDVKPAPVDCEMEFVTRKARVNDWKQLRLGFGKDGGHEC